MFERHLVVQETLPQASHLILVLLAKQRGIRDRLGREQPGLRPRSRHARAQPAPIHRDGPRIADQPRALRLGRELMQRLRLGLGPTAQNQTAGCDQDHRNRSRTGGPASDPLGG
jgi:hypothetical protein